jgi:membrane-associated phospholipid phosphatase
MSLAEQHAPDASPVEKADIDATAKLAQGREHWFLRACGPLTKVADQEPLFAIGGAVLLVGLARRRGREVEAGLRILAAEALATAIKSAIKNRVARTRPNHMLDEDEYRAEADEPEGKFEQSFPSGHTSGAVAVAGVLAPVYPKAALPLFGWATGVGALLPVRGAHFIADVAAGAAIGAVSAFVVDRAARAIKAALR